MVDLPEHAQLVIGPKGLEVASPDLTQTLIIGEVYAKV